MSEHEDETTRVSEGGETTIPEAVRERLDVRPGDRVRWSEEAGTVTVEKQPPESTHGILLSEEATEEDRRAVAAAMDEYVTEKRRTEWDGTTTRSEDPTEE